MKTLLLPVFTLVAGFAFSAVPEVSNVQFSQGSDRKVTITYDLENGPAIITCDILSNAVDAVSGVSIGDENLHYMTGDVNCRVDGEAGKKTSHTIVWEADKAWPDHKIRTESVRAKVTAWALDNPPEYMVIDLVLPSGATAYDIAYYTSSNAIPGGLLADESYRTTKLVLRHVHAPESGKFVAGNLAEPNRSGRPEENQHTMALTKDYWLGVFQFTQGGYYQVMGAWPSSKFTGDLRRLLPVDSATYNGVRGGTYYPAAPTDSQSYLLGRLTKYCRYAIDFPSEAQWEYAARAGNIEGYWPNGVPISTTIGTSGGEKEPTLERLAWMTTTSDSSTHPVGTKDPNDWGFYDVLGNVYEYCLDYYKQTRTDTDGRVITASEADDSTKMAARGGCYWDQWYNTRTSRRCGQVASGNSGQYGFRFCCPIAPKN